MSTYPPYTPTPQTSDINRELTPWASVSPGPKVLVSLPGLECAGLPSALACVSVWVLVYWRCVALRMTLCQSFPVHLKISRNKVGVWVDPWSPGGVWRT